MKRGAFPQYLSMKANFKSCFLGLSVKNLSQMRGQDSVEFRVRNHDGDISPTPGFSNLINKVFLFFDLEKCNKCIVGAINVWGQECSKCMLKRRIFCLSSPLKLIFSCVFLSLCLKKYFKRLVQNSV